MLKGSVKTVEKQFCWKHFGASEPPFLAWNQKYFEGYKWS